MDFKTLSGLRRHLSVKHHVPGRIRIKFDLAIMGEPLVRELAGSRQSLPPGVKSARLNAMARSVIIEYEAGAIPPDLVEELISASDDARAEELLRELDGTIRAIN